MFLILIKIKPGNVMRMSTTTQNQNYLSSLRNLAGSGDLNLPIASAAQPATSFSSASSSSAAAAAVASLSTPRLNSIMSASLACGSGSAMQTLLASSSSNSSELLAATANTASSHTLKQHSRNSSVDFLNASKKSHSRNSSYDTSMFLVSAAAAARNHASELKQVKTELG